MSFKHVPYSLGFKIEGPLPKTYGIVNRKNGKSYIRNYNRPIPNGMDMWDIIKWRFKKSYEDLDVKYSDLFKD